MTTQQDEDPFAIDLDAERQSRAAEHEGKHQGAPIRLGGRVVATLPPELPLDALAPLRNLDAEVTMLIRTVVVAARQQGEDRQAQTDLVIDMLAANPGLPVQMLDTVKAMAVGLVGEEGYQGLASAKLSLPDIATLVKRTFAFYGLSLGEALPPSDSSEGSGTTSLPTGSTTTDSTSEASGDAQETPGSLVSATS